MHKDDIQYSLVDKRAMKHEDVTGIFPVYVLHLKSNVVYDEIVAVERIERPPYFEHVRRQAAKIGVQMFVPDNVIEYLNENDGILPNADSPEVQDGSIRNVQQEMVDKAIETAKAMCPPGRFVKSIEVHISTHETTERIKAGLWAPMGKSNPNGRNI